LSFAAVVCKRPHHVARLIGNTNEAELQQQLLAVAVVAMMYWGVQANPEPCNSNSNSILAVPAGQAMGHGIMFRL
jgi:hypothetical protein